MDWIDDPVIEPKPKSNGADGPPLVAPEPVIAATYASLEKEAGALSQGDMDALKAYLKGVAGADVGKGESHALLKVAAKASGFPLRVVEPLYKEAGEWKRKLRHEDDIQKGRLNDLEVYVLGQNKMLKPSTGGMIAKDAFLTEKARECHGSKQEAEQIYLTGEKALCPVVDDITYDPALPSGINNGLRKFNLYRPTLLKPTPGDVSPWLALVRELDFQGGEADESALFDYLAATVQRPGIKVNFGMLIGGAHRIGKDSVMEPFYRAVGLHNVKTAQAESLTGQFNSYFAGAKVLNLQEIAYGGHKDAKLITQKLKNGLAAPPDTLRINEKNRQEYEIPNVVQIVANTNYEHALHAERGDQRWLGLWCCRPGPENCTPGKWASVQDSFTRYWTWLNNGGDAKVYAWLLSRDLSGFNRKAAPPKTGWLREMEEQSESPLLAWIRSGIAGREGVFHLPVVNTRAVAHQMERDPQARNLPRNNTVLGEVLKTVLGGEAKRATMVGKFWVIDKTVNLDDRTLAFWRDWNALAAKEIKSTGAVKSYGSLPTEEEIATRVKQSII